ncbi:hypothetical protein [Streptomyces sp. NPDC095602]|uniref:hypothetical protein n=1 Tax=Streptomyces sp. NPDC095602 TaxID=3155819 RepID=UPI0033257188
MSGASGVSGVSDEEIAGYVRALADLERRREALAERVGELRLAATPRELAERDRLGTELAVLTDVVLLESAATLGHLGLTTAALAVQHVLETERPTGEDD